MKKILYKNPEGGVHIVYPVAKEKIEPVLLADHKRKHEKAEKAKREAADAAIAAFVEQNPGVGVPKELEYVRTKCPEFVFGEAEYEAHVRERSLKLNDADGNFIRPITAEEDGLRDLEDADIPTSREFRSAWCDDLPGSNVNISCSKARDLMLEALRAKRDAELKKTDGEYMMLLETAPNGNRMRDLKLYRQQLRDATSALVNMDVAGKYDDEALLAQMLTECEKDLSEGNL